MEQTDALLSYAIERAITIFKSRMDPGNDHLYVLVTTDHGMLPVDTLVNAEHICNPPLPRAVRIVTSGTFANVYFDRLSTDEDRKQAEDTLLTAANHLDYVTAYRRSAVPKSWGYTDPSRIGDIVLSLAPGYAFSTKLPATTFPSTQVGEPLGMHGYPADECPQMLGFAVVWRYGANLGGKDLGRVDERQFDPTVAKLLGIKPSPAAVLPPLRIKPVPAKKP
jgi:hypothetical protein